MKEATGPNIAAAVRKANSFMRDLQNWLEGSPLSDLQIALRRQMDAEHRRSQKPPSEPELPRPGPQHPAGSGAAAEAPELVEVTVQFPKNRR